MLQVDVRPPIERRLGGRPVAFALDRRRLRVGLVNNMPDAALAATERQFRTLMEAASPGRSVELQLFHIPAIVRGPEADARLRARYRPVEAIEGAGLDALIVTGAEPRAGDLREEPFWPALQRLCDQAAASGTPTLWSCLAAHAAVLHLDAIVRRPLAAKCSGLFAVRPTEAAANEAAPDGPDRGWAAAHSRGNGLDEEALTARGYRILTRGPDIGVDAFTRRVGRSQFLFLQGHPEYDTNSLALEFKRDLLRYVEGLRATPPALPQGVFGADSVHRVQALVDAAREGRGREAMTAWPAPSQLALAPNTWRAPAAQLLRRWLAASLAREALPRL